MSELRSHEINTNQRYSAYKTSKHFGNTSILTGKKVFWSDQQSVSCGRQEFTGVPFMVLGRKVLDCQFGKDRHLKAKERRKNLKSENDHYGYKRGGKFIVQHTKKLSCPARCVMRELCRFPTYKLALEYSLYERKEIGDEIYEKVQNGEQMQVNRVIIVTFPYPEEHKCHKEGEIPPEPIDPRISEKIREMSEAGVRDIEGMKKVLRIYVSEICDPLPDEKSHRFYPTDKIICNHIYNTNKSGKIDDQKSLIELVQGWRRNGNVYCRLKGSGISSDVCNKDVEYGDSFLFVYQSLHQKRLLMRYGSMVFLDATYKTTLYDLPLFFLAVRTNVGYHIVGTFLCEKETTDAIEEGLRILSLSCPSWKPSFFLTDFHESEIMAVERVFSDTKVLLCDVHRNRAWDRWLRRKDNLVDDVKDVMKWLMRLGNAKDVQTFESLKESFQGTDQWLKKQKLQNYMCKIWFPEKERWSKAFRVGLVDIVAGTNNGLESHNNVFKSKFLHKKTTYSLGSMLKVIDACIHLMATEQIFHIDCAVMTSIFGGSHESTSYLPTLLLQGYEAIIGAVNEGGNHWVLMIIIPGAQRVVYLNPLGEKMAKNISVGGDRCKKGIETSIEPDGWEVETVPHVKQQDGSSCGIYVIKFAEQFISGGIRNITLTKENIERERKEIQLRLISMGMPEQDVNKKPLRQGRKKLKRSSFVYADVVKVKKPKKLYCICQKPYDGMTFMIQCNLCEEWYHKDCISLSEEDIPEKGKKFFCHSCRDTTTINIVKDCVEDDDDEYMVMESRYYINIENVCEHMYAALVRAHTVVSSSKNSRKPWNKRQTLFFANSLQREYGYGVAIFSQLAIIYITRFVQEKFLKHEYISAYTKQTSIKSMKESSYIDQLLKNRFLANIYIDQVLLKECLCAIFEDKLKCTYEVADKELKGTIQNSKNQAIEDGFKLSESRKKEFELSILT